MAVEGILSDINIAYEKVDLGSATIQKPLNSLQYQQLEKKLNDLGFSMAKTREMVWIETIKLCLIQLFEKDPSNLNLPISHLLAERVGVDYSRLSHLFSISQGKTIADYFIELKIEKAKEWLSYDEFNISQTALKLGYNSVQYFSTQFKKTTGLTPSEFKRLATKPRKPLDSLGENR
jgi:AraC-like DNA-binding protein